MLLVSTMPKLRHGEAMIDFYDEHLVAQADTVYRFAYGLTLSLSEAHGIVQRTFQVIASSLGQFHISTDTVVPALIAESWRVFKETKGGKGVPGQTGAVQFLGSLALEARASLLAVDVAGLSPGEAAQAFGWSENDLRAQLATARRALLTSTLDI